MDDLRSRPLDRLVRKCGSKPVRKARRQKSRADRLNRAWTCGALFSGIGGFCAGFEEMGFQTSWAVDASPAAAKVYAANFPNTPIVQKDITKLVAKELPAVDVMHAGFPCQSFSGAGDRLGFGDPRGKLFFDVIRLVREWGKNKPRVIVLENSPFLLAGDEGRWFDVVRAQIQSAGYWFSSVNCYVLGTYEHAGIPQQRKRLFMVAVCRDRFDHNGVTITSKETSKKKELLKLLDLNSKIDELYFLPRQNRYNELITKYVTPEFPDRIYQLRKYIVRAKEAGICPTLTANMGDGGHNVPFVFDSGRLRKLTERECLRLQGFPEKFILPGGMPISQHYRLIGNAVSPPIARIVAEAVKHFMNAVG